MSRNNNRQVPPRTEEEDAIIPNVFALLDALTNPIVELTRLQNNPSRHAPQTFTEIGVQTDLTSDRIMESARAQLRSEFCFHLPQDRF